MKPKLDYQYLANILWARGWEGAWYYKYLASTHFRLEKSLELILDMTGDEDTVLDVGTALGSIPLMIVLNKPKVVAKGTDIREVTSANRIIKFFPEAQTRLFYQQQDVMKLEEKHDIVICMEILEHIEDDKKAFEMIWNTAKKAIFMSVPNENSSTNVAGHLRRYTREMIEELINPYTRNYTIENDRDTEHFYFVKIKKEEKNGTKRASRRTR